MGFTGIILSGGQSSRMKKNKAFLLLNEKTFIEETIEKLKTIVDEVIVVTNEPDLYKDLSAHVVTDIIPKMGPLSGIHAGLTYATNEYSFIVACDMPFISTELGAHLLSVSKGFDVVVPQIGEFLQPLHAVYGKGCIKPIEELLANDRRRIVAFYPSVKVNYIGNQTIGQFVSDQDKTFYNVNTPAELETARQMVGRDKDE